MYLFSQLSWATMGSKYVWVFDVLYGAQLSSNPTVYRLDSKTIATLLISSWQVWAESDFIVDAAHPKRPINLFKTFQQSSQHAPNTFCPNTHVYCAAQLSSNPHQEKLYQPNYHQLVVSISNRKSFCNPSFHPYDRDIYIECSKQFK